MDLRRTDLYALYSGYTKGKDLVGTQDATVSLCQFSPGMPGSDANTATLDMLSPLTVGGVAWDFPHNQTDYFLQTLPGSDFALPADTGWAIEMWVNLNSLTPGGYFIS